MDDLWVMGMAYSMNLYEWIQFIDIHWYLLYIYRHYRIIMNCKDVVFTIPLLTLFLEYHEVSNLDPWWQVPETQVRPLSRPSCHIKSGAKITSQHWQVIGGDMDSDGWLTWRLFMGVSRPVFWRAVWNSLCDFSSFFDIFRTILISTCESNVWFFWALAQVMMTTVEVAVEEMAEARPKTSCGEGRWEWTQPPNFLGD